MSQFEDELDEVPVKVPEKVTPKKVDGSVSLSDLRSILEDQAAQNQENLHSLIQELRKPTVLEQKELDKQAKAIADANAERKDNADGIRWQMADKRNKQLVC